MAIRKAKKQSEKILLWINQPFNYRNIYRALEMSVLSDTKNQIKRIDITTNNVIQQFSKRDIRNGLHEKVKAGLIVRSRASFSRW